MPQRDTDQPGLLRPINTTIVPAACLAIWLIAAGGPAGAQTPSPTGPGEGLSEGPVRQAFSVAENWVRRGSVPDSTLPIRMKGVTAVHVTLRSGGPTFGQATESVADPANPAAPGSNGEDQQRGRDLMKLIRPAVKKALREAYGKISGVADLSEAGAQLTLDLQVAGVPERVKLERLGELPSKITINVDGLAMRKGSEWAWQFPGNSIAANTNLKGQVERLLSALNLPLVQLQQVGREGGPALYRFDAVHIVRPGPNQPVVRLHRGNRLLPPTPLRDRQLVSLSRRLADHLLARQQADGRFSGTYEPTADQYSPTTAPDLDGAQAAFALARTARLPGLEDARRTTLSEAAREAVRSLVSRVAAPPARREGRPRRLAPTAMTLLALLETPGLGAIKESRVRLVAALKTLQRDDGRFNMGTDDQEPAPLMMQGLGAAAMVALFDQRRDPAVLDRARRALDALWQRRGTSQPQDENFDATLPWLAYAELDLARLGHPTGRMEDLLSLCEQLWERQLVPWETPDNGEPSPDAIGGFVEPNSLMEEPTWETAPRLAAQALILRDPEWVPSGRRSRWLIRCGLGARFLSQLTLRRINCYYCRSPSTAIGGTRLNFWNNRQPLSATAASLLAVTELRHALHRLQEETDDGSAASDASSPNP